MRLLLLTTSLGIGGAEKQVVDLASEFKKKGFYVLIVSLVENNEILKLKEYNLDTKTLNMTKGFFSLTQGLTKLKGIIKKEKIDLIHSHMFHANIFARIYKFIFFSKIPLITTAHNSNEGGNLRMLTYRLTDFLTCTTTNVSIDSCEKFISLHAFKKEKTQLVYNGIDFSLYEKGQMKNFSLKKEYNLSNNCTIFITVGRLEHAKDHITLLKTMKQLIDSGFKTFKLFIIGEGSLKSFLEIEIIRLNLAYHVKLLGHRSNVVDYMKNADLFLLSSAWEGLPLVLIEAIASRLLIISTDAGGSREIINNDNLIVPIKDHLAFSSKIIEIMNLPKNTQKQLINAMYENAFKCFSIDSIVSNWILLYKKTIESKSQQY